MSTAGHATGAWGRLAGLARGLDGVRTPLIVGGEPRRIAEFSCRAAGVLLDYTRQHLDLASRDALCALADAVELRAAIDAMFRGDRVNVTEGRAALHAALRQPPGAGIGGPAIEREVLGERERVLRFAEAVRGGIARGSGGALFKTVVNIGIGGSDLGPAMAVEALKGFCAGSPHVRFVSSVDGCALRDTLDDTDAASTLFIVASKTFTTQETMANARTARAWLCERLGESAVPAHFAAVSVNTRAMDEFGIHPDHRFFMWDWVGGRYSVWSSIGVSLAIAIGRTNFLAFLEGAHRMDENFRDAPWTANLPVMLALVGVWNINFQALPTLAVLPYDSRLARLPAWLQQLDMESNGKSVRRDGSPVFCETAPVVWGEPGSNAQHSFFQLLHQGSARAALEFLLPAESSCGLDRHHELAIANCLAQAEAFMTGQSGPDVPPHKVHPGSRPSSILMFERVDPRSLGALLAAYEHKVYAQAMIWGVNPFDQWGVELGKRLADDVLGMVRGTAAEAPSPTLAGSLAALAAMRRPVSLT